MVMTDEEFLKDQQAADSYINKIQHNNFVSDYGSTKNFVQFTPDEYMATKQKGEVNTFEAIKTFGLNKIEDFKIGKLFHGNLSPLYERARMGYDLDDTELQLLQRDIRKRREFEIRGTTFGADIVDIIASFSATKAMQVAASTLIGGAVGTLASPGAGTAAGAAAGWAAFGADTAKDIYENKVINDELRIMEDYWDSVDKEAALHARAVAKAEGRNYVNPTDIEISAGKVLTNYGAELLNDNSKPATRFMQAVAQGGIEVVSELAGEVVQRKLGIVAGGGSKVLGKFLNRLDNEAAQRFVDKAAQSTLVKTGMKLPQALRKFGWNGWVLEVGEEYFADILNFTFGLDDVERTFENFVSMFTDPREFALRAVSLGLIGSAQTGLVQGEKYGMYRKTAKAIEEKCYNGLTNSYDYNAMEKLIKEQNPTVTAEQFGKVKDTVEFGIMKVKDYSMDDFLVDAGVIKTAEKEAAVDELLKEEGMKHGKTKEEMDEFNNTTDFRDKISLYNALSSIDNDNALAEFDDVTGLTQEFEKKIAPVFGEGGELYANSVAAINANMIHQIALDEGITDKEASELYAPQIELLTGGIVYNDNVQTIDYNKIWENNFKFNEETGEAYLENIDDIHAELNEMRLTAPKDYRDLYDELADKTGLLEPLAGSDLYFMYAGVNGAKNIKPGEYKEYLKERAAQAKFMLQDNFDDKSVYNVTGWFRGQEGKWRFEIDDSLAELSSNWDKKENKLGKILKHDLLFNAYPKMKDIKVIPIDNKGNENVKGIYNPKKNTIKLNKSLDKKEVMYILLHELQHYIQTQEGFARGTNINTEYKKFVNEQLSLGISKKDIQKFEKDNPDELNDIIVYNYLMSHGEIEANDVANRYMGIAEEYPMVMLADGARTTGRNGIIYFDVPSTRNIDNEWLEREHIASMIKEVENIRKDNVDKKRQIAKLKSTQGKNIGNSSEISQLEQEIEKNLKDIQELQNEIVQQAKSKKIVGYTLDDEIVTNVIGIIEDDTQSSDERLKTVLHEMGHHYLIVQNKLAKSNKNIAKRVEKINEWLGADGVNYTIEQQEKFANAYTVWLATESPPNVGLSEVFRNFRTWIKKIIASISDNIVLTDEIREVFSEMIGGDYIGKYRADSDLYLKNKFKEYNIKSYKGNIDKGLTKKYKQDLIKLVSAASGKTISSVNALLRTETGGEQLLAAIEQNSDYLSANQPELLRELGYADSLEVNDSMDIANRALNDLLTNNYQVLNEDILDEHTEYVAKINFISDAIIKDYNKSGTSKQLLRIANEILIRNIADSGAFPGLGENIREKFEDNAILDRQRKKAKVLAREKNIAARQLTSLISVEKITLTKAKNIIRKSIMNLKDISRADVRSMFSKLQQYKTISELINAVPDIYNYQNLLNEQYEQKLYRSKITNLVNKAGKIRSQNGIKRAKYEAITQGVFIALRKVNKMDSIPVKLQESIEKAFIESLDEQYNTGSSDIPSDITNAQASALENAKTEDDIKIDDLSGGIIGRYIKIMNDDTSNSVALKMLLDDLSAMAKTGRSQAKTKAEANKQYRAGLLIYAKQQLEVNKGKNQKNILNKATAFANFGIGGYREVIDTLFGDKFFNQFNYLFEQTEIDGNVQDDILHIESEMLRIYGLKNDYQLKKNIAEMLQYQITSLENLKTGSQIEVKYNKLQLIDMYCATKNEETRQLLCGLDSYGEPLESVNPQMSLNNYKNLMSELTPQDIAFGDLLCDMTANYYDSLNSYTLDIYGLPMTKVQNYYPRIADRNEVPETNIFGQEIKKDLKVSSMQKERTAGKGQRFIFINALSHTISHIRDANQIIVNGANMNNLFSVLKNSDILKLIKQYYGNVGLSLYKKVLNSVTPKEESLRHDIIMSMVDRLTNSIIGAKIIGKAMAFFKQSFMFCAYALPDAYVSIPDMGLAFADELKTIMTKSPKHIVDYMFKNSKYVRARYYGGLSSDAMRIAANDTGILNLGSTISDKIKVPASLYAGASTVRHWLGLPVKAGDISAIILGGYAYIHALMKKGYTTEEALRLFTLKSETSQQSVNPWIVGSLQKDLAGGGGLFKPFVAFMNAQLQGLRNVTYSIQKGLRGESSAIEVIANTSFYLLIQYVLFNLISMGLPDDNDEKEKNRFIGSTLTGWLQGIPIIGNGIQDVIINNVFGAGYAEQSGYWSMILKAWEPRKNKYGEEFEFNFEDYLRAVSLTLEPIAGISIETLYNESVGAAKELSKGEFGVAFWQLLGDTPYRAHKKARVQMEYPNRTKKDK